MRNGKKLRFNLGVKHKDASLIAVGDLKRELAMGKVGALTYKKTKKADPLALVEE